MSDILEYNYDEFVEEKFGRWMRFDESPLLGKVAPDYELIHLDGTTVHLSDLWKQSKYLIVEFGSFT